MCFPGSVTAEGEPATVVPSCTGLAVGAQAQVCALCPPECQLLASCSLGNRICQPDFSYFLNAECS